MIIKFIAYLDKASLLDRLFWGYLIILFIGFMLYSLNFIKVNGRFKLSLVAAIVIAVLPVPIISNLRNKISWSQIEFSGQIVSKNVSKNHAIIEYSIMEKNQKLLVVFDEFWKLKEFEVGDWVEKREGYEAVQIIPQVPNQNFRDK